MRVVSLVPSVTDVLAELGAYDELVAVSYACTARAKEVVVRPVIDTDGLSPEEVDRLIAEAKREKRELYLIDVEKIRSLKPDVIFAQGVCDVCAVTADNVSNLLRGVAPVVELSPSSVQQILDDILHIGKYVKRLNEAEELVEKVREKIEYVRRGVEGLPRRRCCFLEWLFPPYCSGHWVPELVEIAGGQDLGLKGQHSRRVTQEEIISHAPEKLIAGPCGYGLDKTLNELSEFVAQPWLADLPCFEQRQIYATNADKYFSRHGPSVGEAALILAEIIHPEKFRDVAPPNSYKKWCG